MVNLLDMSRIQAGAVAPATRPVGLEEVVPAAVAGLGERGLGVAVDVPESLPAARRTRRSWSGWWPTLWPTPWPARPPASPCGSRPGEVGDRVLVRVVDRGPGIPLADREQVFRPFQRLGDRRGHGAGVGLGLAVARGFTRAMGGELSIDDTPGGGTTMVIDLQAAGASERSEREP